jgi:hypothetical protein
MATFPEIIEQGKYAECKACVDCYMVLVNGDASGNSDDWNEAKYAETCNAYNITAGHFHTGEYSNCSHAGTECEDDCDCERTEFSWSGCDICGSHLGGTRYDVIMIKRELLAAETVL